MKRFRIPFIVFSFSLGVLISCSDDDPITFEHFYNPVVTPDGRTLVAGYDTGIETTVAIDGRKPSSSLAVMDIGTRRVRLIDLVSVPTVHNLYAFDPTGSVLAFVQSGIRLFDLDGREVTLLTSNGNVEPEVCHFLEGSPALLWAGSNGSHMEIHRLVLDPSDWSVLDDSILVSASVNGQVLSITAASSQTVAVRLSDGDIRVYGFGGNLLHQISSSTFTSENPWHYKLMYYQRELRPPSLYFLEHRAIVQFDLVAGERTVLVSGYVTDVDVSDKQGAMVYETKNGDTWLATPVGIPLVRIAPQNIMPRFSPDGKKLAMVERINRYTDSLHVMTF